MYLIAIAWMYVVVMMTIAEAASPGGTLLGAFFTFVLYGLLPLSIVLYILGTPARKRRLKARQEQEALAAGHARPSPGFRRRARCWQPTDRCCPDGRRRAGARRIVMHC
jgi:hypothetical protein